MEFAGLAGRTAGVTAARVHGHGGLTRARLASVAMAVVLVGLAASASPVQAAVKPVISNLKAEPATVGSYGTTTISASVAGATTCTLEVVIGQAVAHPVEGLPFTFPCEGGLVQATGMMPPQKKTVKIVLALTAIGIGGKKAEKKVGVSVTHSTSYSDVAVEVTGISSVTQVSAGRFTTCALLSDRHVECWGWGGEGQLGDGTTTSSDVPVEVTGISTATQVTAGGLTDCAVLSNGHLECWGANEYGQLGDGTTTNSDVPVEVTGISTATQVSGGGHSTCAVLSNGRVECWGENGFGQLGNGTTTSSDDVPVEVTGISTATQVTAGQATSCALLSDGHVECWGANSGELGDGTSTGPESCISSCSRTPVEVTGISTATQLSGRCAVLSNGHVECWGANEYGQLGDGTSTGPERCIVSCSTTPVEAIGISSATQVSGSPWTTCVLLSNSHADCWGENSFGQLGDGTSSVLESAPVEVTVVSTPTQVSAGYDHTCAVIPNGRVECWGWNLSGQLGNGGWHDDLVSASLSGEL
jgi:alpha-tubulin suppressor-like RCC1 family protein